MESTSGRVPREKRKVVYAGIDVPGVDLRGPGRLGEQDLARNLDRIKSLPFDGLVVNIVNPDPKVPFPRNIVGNDLFSGVRYEWETVRGAVDGLRLLKGTGKTENFFLVASGYWFESGKNNKFDWFDDRHWNNVEQSVSVYARLAKEAGTIRGIFLDTEPYRKPPEQGGEEEWAYNIFSLNVMFNQVNNLGNKGNPRAAYQNRLKDCGASFLANIHQHLPDCPILLYLGNGLALDRSNPNTGDLFPFFLDGMLRELDRRKSRGFIVDGYEGGYKLRTAAEHQHVRDIVLKEWKAPSTVPDLYAKYMRVGIGKWLDAGEGGAPAWNEKDPNANFYHPADWQNALDYALDAADEYVWIWAGGKARVFPMTFNRPANVPAAYLNAVRQAKTSR